MNGESLRVAERLVALAEQEGATQAEAVVMATESALTRFANSEIHQNVAERDMVASLRFIAGKRIGVASSDRLDDDGLRALADTARRIASVQPEQEDFVSLPGPEPIPELPDGFSEATASSTPETRADAVAAVIGAADAAGVLAFGAFSVSADTLAIANSLGIRAAEATTQAHLVTVAMGADGESGYAESLAVDAGAIDAGAIGREAAGRAVRSRNARALPAGQYAVVLEPYAVSDLMDMLGYLGLSALPVQEGRSFFEPGRRVASELVSTWDDGTDSAGTPTAFDFEGVPKRRVPFLERGACVDVVYDSHTAFRTGRTSTGHALPAPNPWGPLPTNQFMAAGDASDEELVRGLERGLLITRFNYTNPVHPKRVIVTGMTRDGTFLVEHGEIVGPVKNLRYTQGYLDALAAVEAVGRDRRLVRGLLGTCLVPSLRIGAWDFTGTTEH